MFDNIPIREDILVILVAILLYVTDIARLLYFNEILLVHGTLSDWSAITPSDGVLVARRRLVFPGLFDPGTVVFRFQWPLDEQRIAKTNATASTVNEKLRFLRFPRLFCMLLLPEIFLGLPLGYFLSTNSWILLGLLVIIYVQIIALVIWLFFARRQLSFTWQTCFMLAFESLICIPYAINFHRKIAEKSANINGMDLLETGEQLLGKSEREELRTYICDAIDDRLAGYEADVAARNRLASLRAKVRRSIGNEP